MDIYRKLHLYVGAIGFITFALEGQYMMWVLSSLQNTPDGERMLYRSAHIYLMLTCCLNFAIGLYASNRLASRWTIFESIVLLIAPFLFTLEFFFGTADVNSERIFAYIPLIVIFAVFSLSFIRALWLRKL